MTRVARGEDFDQKDSEVLRSVKHNCLVSCVPAYMMVIENVDHADVYNIDWSLLEIF